MKRLLITGILLFGLTAGYAQKFEKKIAASDKSIADEKKGANPKTWIARGELMYEIATTPTLGLVVGMDSLSYTMAMAAVSEEAVEKRETVGGKVYKTHTFANKKIYFTNGIITFWDVLKYDTPKPMKQAFDAYQKAKSLDAAGKNNKKIGEKLNELSTFSQNEAFNQYQLGHNANALELFCLSLECSSDPTVGKTDTAIYYYAGVIAAELGENAIAEKYLKKAIEIKHIEGGNTYAVLADVYNKTNRPEEARSLLENGMLTNPENQQILFGLINNYMAAQKDPKDIIPLIKKAQEKESNASLYFAEGQLHEKLEDVDNAKKCYEKSVEIDPEYFFGYYGIGILHFNKAAQIDILAMAEKDNKKYEELVSQSDDQLKQALPYFEKAYALKNPDNHTVVVKALKDINFRLRTEGDKYKADADKYTKMLEELEK
ncbi:MAG: tetratricopeptide repeat protein [Prevotellaceae bacterium]|jgi:tetratricopeptide (TPR) repeat protein|nr:tetratricopeptide repeat protein [Prevotellaceae bacterium]